MPAELDNCVSELMSKGNSEESAYAICNSQLYGSSSIGKYGADGMSAQLGAFPPKGDGEEKPKEETADISMSQQQASTVAAFIMNADTAFQTGEVTPELEQQLEEAKAVIQEVMNVQPEEGPSESPSKPPA